MLSLVLFGIGLAILGKILSKPKTRYIETPQPIRSRSSMFANGVETDVHCPNCGRYM